MTEKAPEKNTLFQLVDKAPFAGKFTVKDVYVGFDTAPDEKKTRRALGAAAFMAFMVAVHAYQAKMGIDSLAVHAPAAAETGNAHDIIYSGIDGTYALAMSAVAVRQAELFGKVGQKYYRWRKERETVPENERVPAKRPYTHKAGAVALAFGATMGGQAAEIVSWVDAQLEKREAAIQEYYDQQPSYDMYEQNRVHINTDPSSKVAKSK